MKSYLSIPGPRDAPIGWPCIAFFKHDGSNLRFEWSRKQGWHKFGTRNRMFDQTDPEFGRAIPIFMDKYSEAIVQVIRGNKDYRGVDRCIVFCEFEGKDSFAGYHNYDAPFDLILIDVNPHKKGLIAPRKFIKDFGHLHIPRVVYEGNFNRDFIRAIRHGEFDVKEGVVAKGIKPGKTAPHGLWYAKAKTQWWLDELKRRAETDESLKLVLEENLGDLWLPTFWGPHKPMKIPLRLERWKMLPSPFIPMGKFIGDTSRFGRESCTPQPLILSWLIEMPQPLKNSSHTICSG